MTDRNETKNNYYSEILKPEILNRLKYTGGIENQYLDCPCGKSKKHESEFSINGFDGVFNCFKSSCGLKQTGNCYDIAKHWGIDTKPKKSDFVSWDSESLVSRHIYNDPDGKPHLIVERHLKYQRDDSGNYVFDQNGKRIQIDGKEFKQFVVINGKSIKSKFLKKETGIDYKDVIKYPYNIDKIKSMEKDGSLRGIVILEGEKSCDTFSKHMNGSGYIPTTNPHGAKKMDMETLNFLKEIDVSIPKFIIPDNDRIGSEHAFKIASMGGKRIDFFPIPITEFGFETNDSGEDIHDWFETYNHKPDELIKIFETIKQSVKIEMSDDYLFNRIKHNPESTAGKMRELTDTGNFDIFNELFSGKFKYVFDHNRGSWFMYDNKIGIWIVDTMGSLKQQSGEQIPKVIFDRASKSTSSTDSKSYAGHYVKSLGGGSQKRLIEIAENRPSFRWSVTNFNQNLYMIPCRNGYTLDLSGTKLNVIKSTPDHFHSKHLNVDYVEISPFDDWQIFLEKSIPDPDIQDLLQEICGSCLIGEKNFQKLFFFYGNGANGKSIFSDILMELFGEFGVKAEQSVIESGMNVRTSNMDSVARLKDARLVVTQETGEGNRLNETMIKDMTGGDMITGKFLYGNTFQFKPGFTLIMYGNHKPVIYGSDEGIKRRVVLIPWERIFKDSDPDRIPPDLLKSRLRGQFSGILNWMIEGYFRLKNNQWKFSIPEKVKNATDGYFEENDRIKGFILECIEPMSKNTWLDLSLNDRRNSSPIYRAYQIYCRDEGMNPVSNQKFRNLIVGRIVEWGDEPFQIEPHFEGTRFRGFVRIDLNSDWTRKIEKFET